MDTNKKPRIFTAAHRIARTARTSCACAGVGALLLAGAPRASAHDKASEDHMFQSMDTNGDGKVSPEEHAAGAKAMFEKMDANHDGKVTASEMAEAHEKVTGRKAGANDMSAADKIKVIDSDGDGVITADEHAAGAKKMFEKMDTNHDGFLSKTEIAVGHAQMMHKTTTPTGAMK